MKSKISELEEHLDGLKNLVLSLIEHNIESFKKADQNFDI
jgi:hypothetical protein